MVTYLCEVIDMQAGERIVIVNWKCVTFECAKFFIESSMLRLVPSFIATRANWEFWEEKVIITSEEYNCPVYGKITNVNADYRCKPLL